jgi:hypothetical protein
MIADLPKNIELKFWDVVLPAMSNNTKFRKWVKTAYEIVQDDDLRKTSIIIFSGSFAGFLLGFCLFFFVK